MKHLFRLSISLLSTLLFSLCFVACNNPSFTGSLNGTTWKGTDSGYDQSHAHYTEDYTIKFFESTLSATTVKTYDGGEPIVEGTTASYSFLDPVITVIYENEKGKTQKEEWVLVDNTIRYKDIILYKK